MKALFLLVGRWASWLNGFIAGALGRISHRFARSVVVLPSIPFLHLLAFIASAAANISKDPLANAMSFSLGARKSAAPAHFMGQPYTASKRTHEAWSAGVRYRIVVQEDAGAIAIDLLHGDGHSLYFQASDGQQSGILSGDFACLARAYLVQFVVPMPAPAAKLAEERFFSALRH